MRGCSVAGAVPPFLLLTGEPSLTHYIQSVCLAFLEQEEVMNFLSSVHF